MKISLIWAMSENHVIGKENGLPWHLPEDLSHFKRLTSGHTIVMGRRTFDSIGRRALPDRRSIVVTRNQQFEADNVTVAHSLDKALDAAKDAEKVFIVGGAGIYHLALPRADELCVTLVHAEVEGDVLFGEIDWDEWELADDQSHEKDDRHEYAFSIRRYCRRS